jgi:ATP-dependent protease ClpP protease subunit
MNDAPNWFEFKNSAEGDQAAEILIYDEIGRYGTNAKAFLEKLNAIKAKVINLRIHSPGGGISEGTAIYNALKRHPARVITHIDGLAASMAGVVALAGDEVHMAANALFMIHNPWGVTVGDEHDHQHTTGLLGKFKDIILGAYQTKTKLPRAQLSKIMDAETWLTAKEAEKLGFVDKITGAVRAFASIGGDFNLSKFQNVPVAVASHQGGFDKVRTAIAKQPEIAALMRDRGAAEAAAESWAALSPVERAEAIADDVDAPVLSPLERVAAGFRKQPAVAAAIAQHEDPGA